MTPDNRRATVMVVDDIAPEHMVNWLLRDLPTCALHAIGRADLADPIAGQPAVTARTMATKTGLRRYQPPLRRASITLSALIGDDRPHLGEVDAAMRADIGSNAWDLAHALERSMIRNGGHHAGHWAVRMVINTYLIDPAAATAHVRQSYQTFFDTAILEGFGRLELCS